METDDTRDRRMEMDHTGDRRMEMDQAGSQRPGRKTDDAGGRADG